MNNLADSSKSTYNFDDEDELFNDSSFRANFDNSSFRENPTTFDNRAKSPHNTSELNVSALCCDEELNGYDKLTGKTWIYPTNYPVRNYQFNIIKAAILQNTLVSLPTGLGKTFIAAVIMYNFYRWYPLGKIIFTAPTRPLVAQQIDACYNIIAIPPNDTIEMTGHMQVNTRKIHWQNKRVFFATPQVIYNDIKSGICPGDKIRCLVIDEAHKARGNYAYCQIVSTLTDMGHRTYRMLALSATPGSRVDDVVNVVKNLHIAHLELRSENCIDVAPYSHSRKINTVVINLGPQLSHLRQQYIEIIDGYARRLKQLNILSQNFGNMSKGRVVMLYKEYQSKERGQRHPQHNNIMKDFTLLITLYHGLELLIKHGSRVFLNFFDEHPEKSWMQNDDRLTMLLERLRDDLGVNPLSLDRSILPDGTIPELPKNLCFGHPKFDKLKEIMIEHFTKAKQNGHDTRAIVFCEYRESVNLVHCLLLQCRPLIVPQMFVGQGSSGKEVANNAGVGGGVSQRQQLRVMRAFVAGACNALVATCVAEEGLDVGSVDLILCFDISSRSPVRLVQRCGRTGRERGGQVYILVTEGREHQTLIDCMRQRDGLNTKILQSKEVENSLYKNNPRMIPRDFTPQCQKMFITVAKKNDPKDKNKDAIEKSKKGQKDLRSMLLGASSSVSSSTSNMITKEEFNEQYPDGYCDTSLLAEHKEYWTMNKDQINKEVRDKEKDLKLHTWLEWQRTLQKTINIEHSKDSEILASLLQYSDARRFELPPSTQNPNFYTQDTVNQNVMMPSPAKLRQIKKKTKNVSIKSPCKKDGDIRALFSTATKSTKSYTKLINDLGIQNHENLPTHLINLLVDLSLDNTSNTKECYMCLSMCNCNIIKEIKTHRRKPAISLGFLTDTKFPDLELIDDINANSLLEYRKKADKSKETIDPFNNDDKKIINNFDLELDFSLQDPCEPSTVTITPEMFISKSESHNNCNFEQNIILKSTHVISPENSNKILDNNFEIGDLEDIFADSPEDIEIKIHDERNQNRDSDNKSKAEEVLSFFGLDSVEDIFADSDSSEIEIVTVKKNEDEVAYNENVKEVQGTTIDDPGSPSILSGTLRLTVPTSPILCSQSSKFNLSIKRNANAKARTSHNRTQDEDNKCQSVRKLNLSPSIVDTSNKSMYTITQLVEMINKSDNEHSVISKSVSELENLSKTNEINKSPILLTQADRKKKLNTSNINLSSSSHNEIKESLIILDSESDSSDTIVYDADVGTSQNLPIVNNESKLNETNFSTSSKRKLDFENENITTSSPYFNKKQKLNNNIGKPMTLQEKVLASLTSNKMENNYFFENNNSTINFVLSPQKENQHPQEPFKKPSLYKSDVSKDYTKRNNLEMLQIFKRDKKVKSPLATSNRIETNGFTQWKHKRRLSFDDSDDDFIDDKKCSKNEKTVNDEVRRIPATWKQMTGDAVKPTTNHKFRKKKKKQSEFLELEAELSECSADSGDELSDDSAGSIVDFICDDNAGHDNNHSAMHAHYLQSVRSPVKGMFKIPHLPKKYDQQEIFSQFVDEDSYEMDSFCVDSHIGLTQANEISELEVAENILEAKRRAKKYRKIMTQDNGDSPVVGRKNRLARQIQSDSEDSS
ncbi:Fanconi anemia group M protein [Achroia grisella]|uniref:Fanconi anemia group M protein n=1 Tax=Achroia grisella TaxID=688607 RepID=UPI0027D25AAF|nr:Fanconi anemia group M protein [Achroia grisella]